MPLSALPGWSCVLSLSLLENRHTRQSALCDLWSNVQPAPVAGKNEGVIA